VINVTSKFGGRPKFQKKPPVCKKSAPRPALPPQVPQGFNSWYQYAGTDDNGNDASCNATIYLGQDPLSPGTYRAELTIPTGIWRLQFFYFGSPPQYNWTAAWAPQTPPGFQFVDSGLTNYDPTAPFDTGVVDLSLLFPLGTAQMRTTY